MLACLGVWAGTVSADIDPSAYEARGAVASERERATLERQFVREKAAEAQRAAELAEAERRASELAAAREAARPYAERLTGRRCTVCHPATNYSARRHTGIGWTLVVKRMVYLNDAQIAADEQGVIAAYLAATYPAGSAERLVEYGLPATAALGLGSLFYWGRRVIRRRRTLARVRSSPSA
jgi:hypothetical protein